MLGKSTSSVMTSTSPTAAKAAKAMRQPSHAAEQRAGGDAEHVGGHRAEEDHGCGARDVALGHQSYGESGGE
jgi:hypothetical protein